MTRIVFPFFALSLGAMMIADAFFNFTESNVLAAACRTAEMIAGF